MSYPTVEEITQWIEDDQALELPDQISMDKLTLHYLANRTWAAQIQECYKLNEEVLEYLDVMRASGERLVELVRHALPAGRLDGDHATGYVTFLPDYPPTAAITIPAGTRVYAIPELSTEKLWYRTTVAATLGIGETEVTVAIVAEERGLDSNTGAMTIRQLEGFVSGIAEVENRLAITGGTEDETDAELRQRYFDAVIAPGKATPIMLERALLDLEDVREVKLINRGFGDVEVVVDYTGGIAAVCDDITDCLEENLGGGVQSSGCYGASVSGSTVIVSVNDAYGGEIWVRPTVHTGDEDTFSLTYLDMDGATQAANVTIPAGTHRGEMIKATMASAESRAKKILTVTPSGNNAYDILIGMGINGRLYNLPELISVDVALQIYQTDTPETDLLANIIDSVTAFINSLRIGERLEYSDVQRFIFNEFDPTAEDNIGRPIIGIDEIASLVISDSTDTITDVGDRLTIEEDGRFEPGTIEATLAGA